MVTNIKKFVSILYIETKKGYVYSLNM